MEQSQKTENFSIIKQKIIKTDELIQLFMARNSSLKKMTNFYNDLQEKHEDALSTLNRFELENERLRFSVEQMRSKLEIYEEENKILTNNKLILEHDFNKHVVENMQTIKDLQDELKLLQDINSAAETMNNKEKSPRSEGTINEKPKKRNKDKQECCNKTRAIVQQEYEEMVIELQNENKYLTDQIDELGQKHKEYISEISELQLKVKEATRIEEKSAMLLTNQEELNFLKQEINALREVKSKLEIIQIENELLKDNINKKHHEIQKLQEIQNNKTKKIDMEVQTDFYPVNNDNRYLEYNFPMFEDSNSLSETSSQNSVEDHLTVQSILSEMREYPMPLSPFSVSDCEEETSLKLPVEVPKIIVTPSTPFEEIDIPMYSEIVNDETEEKKSVEQISDDALSESTTVNIDTVQIIQHEDPSQETKISDTSMLYGKENLDSLKQETTISDTSVIYNQVKLDTVVKQDTTISGIPVIYNEEKLDSLKQETTISDTFIIYNKNNLDSPLKQETTISDTSVICNKVNLDSALKQETPISDTPVIYNKDNLDSLLKQDFINHVSEKEDNENKYLKDFLKLRNVKRMKFRMPFKYEIFVKKRRKDKTVLVNKNFYSKLKKCYATNSRTNLIFKALQTLQNSKMNVTMSFPPANNCNNSLKSNQYLPLPTNVASLKKLAEKLNSFTNNDNINSSVVQPINLSFIDSSDLQDNLISEKDNQKHVTEKDKSVTPQEISESVLEKIADLVSKKLQNVKTLKRKRKRTRSFSDYSDSFNSVTEPEIESLFRKKSNTDILQRNKMLFRGYLSKSSCEEQNSCSPFDFCQSLKLNSSNKLSPLQDKCLKKSEMDTDSSEFYKMSTCPTILSPISSVSDSPVKKSVQKYLKPAEAFGSDEHTNTLNSSIGSCMSLLRYIEGESDLLDELLATSENRPTDSISNMDSFLPITDKNDFNLLNKFECNNSPNSIDSGIESKCSPENTLQNDSTEENSEDISASKSSSPIDVPKKDIEISAELSKNEKENNIDSSLQKYNEDQLSSRQNTVTINNFITEQQKEVEVNVLNEPNMQANIVEQFNIDLKDQNQSMQILSEVREFSQCPLSPDKFENDVEQVPICIPLERVPDITEMPNTLDKMLTQQEVITLDENTNLEENKTNTVSFIENNEQSNKKCDLVVTTLRRSPRRPKVTHVKCSDCCEKNSCNKFKMASAKKLNINIRSHKNEVLQLNNNMKREIEARKVSIGSPKSQSNNPIRSCNVIKKSKQKIVLKKSSSEIQELPDIEKVNDQQLTEKCDDIHGEKQMDINNDTEIPITNNTLKKRKPKKMTKIKSNVLKQMRQTSRMFKTDFGACSEIFNTTRINEHSPSSSRISDNTTFFNDKDNFNSTESIKYALENPQKDEGKIKILQDIKLNMSINLSNKKPESVDERLSMIPAPVNCNDGISSSPNENSKKHTSVKKSKPHNSSNSCDILTQIITEMDKDKPQTVTNPPSPKKNVPVSIEEKQWRIKILDIAEITQNTIDLRDTLSNEIITNCKKDTSWLKKKLPVKLRLLLNKLFESCCEEKIPDDVVLEFKRLDLETIADVILHRLSEDIYEKPDLSHYPAPLMTNTQRLFLRLMLRLEQEKIENVIDTILNRIEMLLFKVGCNLKSLDPITRLFLAVCRLRGDINRIRTFCCLAFLNMNDLAIPLFFTVLTSWIEIMPMAVDWQKYPMSKVLVQIVHLKVCNMKGFNLIPLKQLLHQHYGYPKERWNCDEMFEDLTQNYLRDPSPASEIAIRLLCKNKDTKWLYQKLNEFFKPLIYKIPSTNVNFKAQVILLMGKLCRHFKPKITYDKTCILEIRRFLSGLAEDDNTHDLIKRSVSFSIDRLPKNIEKSKKMLVKTTSGHEYRKKNNKRKR